MINEEDAKDVSENFTFIVYCLSLSHNIFIRFFIRRTTYTKTNLKRNVFI